MARRIISKPLIVDGQEFPNYRVSICGNVWSMHKQQFMTLGEPVEGYYRLGVDLNGERKSLAVHRMVAMTYLVNDDPVNKKVVDHKNNNPLDNRPNNLEWVTQAENVRRAYALGAITTNDTPVVRHGLNWEELETYPSLLAATTDTGVDRSHIIRVCDKKPGNVTAGGYRWRYLTENPNKQKEIPPESRPAIIDDDSKTWGKYYRVTPDGRIYTVRGRKFMKLRVTGNNYEKIQFSVDGDKKEFFVHRLVAFTFIPNPTPRLRGQVNHKNKDRRDNTVENLEWVSASENIIHAKTTPRIIRF